MPFNATDAERQAAANADLAAKIRLEPPMVRELRSMFAQISRDLEAFFALTGQVQDAQLYAPELTGILTRQYRRVDQEFSGNIIDFLREADEDDPTVIILTVFAADNGMTFDELLTNMENDVTLREQNFIATNVRQDTVNITATTQKDLDASIIFGVLFLADQGIMNPTRAQVAKQSRKEFGRISRSRPNTIAATVTQKAAEGIKQIENDVFFENRNRVFGVPPLKKEEFWITRGDDVVREAHRNADNQIKNENGVFIVGGEQLKHPGDTSLGASAGNVIGCRCSAVLSINDQIPLAIRPEIIEQVAA